MFYDRLIKLVFPTRVGRDRQEGRWANFCGLRSLNCEEPDVRATYNQHGCPRDAE
jgi:hypothetical protein